MPGSLPNTPPGRLTALAFAALIGLATSILAPIIVHWYTDRVAVELQLVAQSSLVDASTELAKLQVAYDRHPVSSLSRVELNLVNTGRKPIHGEEVISPIIVAIDSGRILDVRTDQNLPSPQQIRFELDTNRRWVIVHAPLLNPNDAARFTLLIDRAPPPRVSASARIVGLHAITLSDRRRASSSLWSTLSWTVYLVSFGVALTLLALVFLAYVGGFTHKTRYVWRFRHAFLNSSPTPEQYGNALELAFGEDALLQAVVNPMLAGLAAGRSIPPQHLDTLNRAVEKHIRDARVRSYWIIVALFILQAIGSVYVVSTFVAAARRLGN